MKLKLPGKRETASRIISVRFPPSEYDAIEKKANKSGVPPATLIRAIVTQMIEAGIEVN